jgi:hypothetical protein
MPMDHISNESMRAYLLGQLPDDQATAVEEEYFINRTFFLKMQSVETALIADYLDGRLWQTEKQLFEGRYLRVPALQQKLEDIKRQRLEDTPAAEPAFWWGSWRLALVATSIVVLFLGIWVYRSRIAGHPTLIAGGQTSTQPILSIHLRPNLTKGPDSGSMQFEQPANGSTLNLVLELPGQSSPVQCQARISIVKPDGRWDAVWNSPQALTSTAAGGIQELTVPLGGLLLHAGDYVVEIWSSDGGIRESYVYRVTEPKR